MTPLAWRRYVHRGDGSLIREARLVGDGGREYEIRRPGEGLLLTKLPRDDFEGIYEPLKEEDDGE